MARGGSGRTTTGRQTNPYPQSVDQGSPMSTSGEIPELRAAAQTFKAQVEHVTELLTFDQFILSDVVGSLKDFAEHQPHTVRTAVENKVRAIRNISDSASLRPKYEVMFNQCVVLLVSYFGSSLSDILRASTAHALARDLPVPIADQEVKVAYRALAQPGVAPQRLITDLWLAQKDVSFQDMGSTNRAFKDCLGVELERREHTNDIILGQAARHVIVHGGARIDARMVRQVSAARPRSLKPSVIDGERIQFQPHEVERLAESMASYVTYLVTAIEDLVSRLEAE